MSTVGRWAIRVVGWGLVVFCVVGAFVFLDHSWLSAALLLLAALFWAMALALPLRRRVSRIDVVSNWAAGAIALLALGFLLLGLSVVGKGGGYIEAAQSLAQARASASATPLPMAPTAVRDPAGLATTFAATALPSPTESPVPTATSTPAPLGATYLAIGPMTEAETAQWADHVMQFNWCTVARSYGNLTSGRSRATLPPELSSVYRPTDTPSAGTVPSDAPLRQSVLAGRLKSVVESVAAQEPGAEATWVGKREVDGTIYLLFMVQGQTRYERFSFNVDPATGRIAGADRPTEDLILQARRSCR